MEMNAGVLILIYTIVLISPSQAYRSPFYFYEDGSDTFSSSPISLPPTDFTSSPSQVSAPSPSQVRAVAPSPIHPHAGKSFNVLSYGAAGDGHSNDTKAFSNAWEAACSSSSSDGDPTLVIPHGQNFSINTLTFSGPCAVDRIHVQIDGSIVGPVDDSKWGCSLPDNQMEWLVFRNIHGLSIFGNGLINGGGDAWWNQSKKPCSDIPAAMVVYSCTDTKINGPLRFLDNPGFHVKVENSTRVTISDLSIQAPGDSPNTDGIHVEGSSYVTIQGATIGTGDDCISIGSNNRHIIINNITCGPGHGVSIGSLGREGMESIVEDVRVSNVRLNGTTNGIRIKSWQGGKGHASNIIYEEITLHNVDNPIIIDQYYCPHSNECKNRSEAVEISEVTYKGVHGTSTEKRAVKFQCSESVACTKLTMEKVNITWADDGTVPTTSSCLNAHGTIVGDIFPPVTCFSA